MSADVSLLSMAVAKAEPEPQIMKLLLEYQPEAVSLPDKDGAYSLMCILKDTFKIQISVFIKSTFN